MNDKENETSMVKRPTGAMVMKPVVEPGSLIALEIEDKRQSIPTIGIIKAGLSGDDLTAMEGLAPEAVSEATGYSVEQAHKILERITRAGKAGKSPGILNLPHFVITTDNAAHQAGVDKLLGLRPTNLRVRFLINFTRTVRLRYAQFRQDHTPVCMSTDVPGVAERYILEADEKLGYSNDDVGKRIEVECLRAECPDFIAGKCLRGGTLYLRLPDLEDMGLFNPFEYHLRGGTTDRLIKQVRNYIEGMAQERILASAGYFLLAKIWEDRPYKMKDRKTGKVTLHRRKQQIVNLLMADANTGRRLDAGAETQALSGDAVDNEQRLEEDVPIDADYSEVADDELGPPVNGADVAGKSLVPDPKPEPRAATENDCYICAGCKSPIRPDVKAYCSTPQNKSYFEGHLLCRQCQEKWREKKGGRR